MDAGPFSRRQWATQSLRITAKELSLVGGKNNAITERFSKWVLFPLLLHINMAYHMAMGSTWRKKVMIIFWVIILMKETSRVSVIKFCWSQSFSSTVINGKILLTFCSGHRYWLRCTTLMLMALRWKQGEHEGDECLQIVTASRGQQTTFGPTIIIFPSLLSPESHKLWTQLSTEQCCWLTAFPVIHHIVFLCVFWFTLSLWYWYH